MKNFEFFEPGSLKGAIALLKKHKGKARILAGGTDLIVEMKERLLPMEPEAIIDIKKIPRLEGIDFSAQKGLRLGALTTFTDLERSTVIRKRYPILASAAHEVGSVQIRNRGTIGGNLCHGSPSADIAPPLLALRATAVIVGEGGKRQVPLEKFFKGPGKTVLKGDELLTELLIPPPLPRSAGVYIKLGVRRAMEIAIVAVAAVVSLGQKDSLCREVSVALGAVAPTPMRAYRAEELLRGKPLTEQLIEQAAEVAMEESKPITDIRGSAEYRREMVKVLTRRATKRAIEMVG